jgi:hypothetical protein
MLLVQEYLKTKTFGELAREHGVYASFSKAGHKWSMNYDQIEARESDPLSQQCRGLILATNTGASLTAQAKEVNGRLNYDHICPGETMIIANPMTRFFNHGQGSAAEINWHDPSLRVMEKLDGTLAIVYYDVFINQWCVATRSVPEADIPLDNGLFTFRTLFEKSVTDSLNMSFSDLTKKLNPWMTYCFELTTPYNRIVVQYESCSVTLLAVKYCTSGAEVDLESSEVTDRYPFLPRVKVYILNTADEIVNWVSEQNPLQHEGVVVMDSKFNRIKVKNASYIAFSKARDVLGTSMRNCLELVLSEKDDDVMAALPPEIVKNLVEIKAGVKTLLVDYDNVYSKILSDLEKANSTSKKDFALCLVANSIAWQAPFFQMYDKKAANMREFIAINRKSGSWGNGFLDKILEILQKNGSITGTKLLVEQPIVSNEIVV